MCSKYGGKIIYTARISVEWRNPPQYLLTLASLLRRELEWVAVQVYTQWILRTIDPLVSFKQQSIFHSTCSTKCNISNWIAGNLPLSFTHARSSFERLQSLTLNFLTALPPPNEKISSYIYCLDIFLLNYYRIFPLQVVICNSIISKHLSARNFIICLRYRLGLDDTRITGSGRGICPHL